MFCSVPRVEEAAVDTDKSVIKARFQSASPMTVYDGNGLWIVDRDVVCRETDKLAVPSVSLMYGDESPGIASLPKEP